MLKAKDGFESWHNEGMTKGRMISLARLQDNKALTCSGRRVNERWNGVQPNIYIPQKKKKIKNQFLHVIFIAVQ